MAESGKQVSEAKPKQIIFVKELVERVREGSVKVTYRKTPKLGTYCVIQNRFKNTPSNLLIEFYKTEKVDPYALGDDDANLAGVQDSATIRKMFEKWYGSPIPSLYRNWFRVIGKS
jgi:hypothetical protein